MNKNTRVGLTAIAAGLIVSGSSGATEVTFIDGGYAEMCSSVAHAVEENVQTEITGSRLTMPPLQVCTYAIEDKASTLQQQAGSYNNRGVLLFDAGMLEEALRDFDQAILIQGDLAAAHVNRGYTLIAMERWADSIPAFDRGIELGAPEPARAHYNRGVAHEEAGHVREAYRDYLTASELDPLWEEPKRELARFSVR
jgi:tetratricopeptide (TPR) repeat protein